MNALDTAKSNLIPGAMLSDSEIMNALKSGGIEITNFDESALTPNGYDLSIGEIMIPDKEIHIKAGKIKIPAMTRFLVGTAEEVYLSENFAAELWIKSRWARRGVLASFGLVDAGFRGILTLGAFPISEIELEIGQRFVQIVFFRLGKSASKTYEKRSGNYQNQKEIKI